MFDPQLLAFRYRNREENYFFRIFRKENPRKDKNWKKVKKKIKFQIEFEGKKNEKFSIWSDHQTRAEKEEKKKKITKQNNSIAHFIYIPFGARWWIETNLENIE